MVFGKEWGSEISDTAINAAFTARPGSRSLQTWDNSFPFKKKKQKNPAQPGPKFFTFMPL